MASLPYPPSCTAQFSSVSPLLPTDSAASYSNSAPYVYYATLLYSDQPYCCKKRTRWHPVKRSFTQSAGPALIAPPPGMLWENCNVHQRSKRSTGLANGKNCYLTPASTSFRAPSSLLVRIHDKRKPVHEQSHQLHQTACYLQVNSWYRAYTDHWSARRRPFLTSVKSNRGSLAFLIIFSFP